MHTSRTTAAVAVAGLIASTALLSAAPSQADVAPQEKDVVATGSDILQSAYNFLADGYGALPGYNTAGNRWRFINLDSSGDAQGRTAYIDPRLVAKSGYLSNGNLITQAQYDALSSADKAAAKPLVKQEDVKQLNPAVALRAGQPLVVRPSGGGGGGRDAIINDYVDGNGIGNWIDVGRSPDPVDSAASGQTNQTKAQTQLGTKLYSVVFGRDRQVIATAATTNAPTSISADDIKKIYRGQITTWGQVTGYDGPAPSETIIPLTLPSDAGMWNTFLSGIQTATGSSTTEFSNTNARSNPNSYNVQQNDPTAISGITDESIRKNAIVPFPKSRATVVNGGYYTVAADGDDQTNPYNGAKTYTGSSASPSGTPATRGNHRLAATASGIKLLAPASTGTLSTDPYGTNFALRAIFRESDLNSNVPWQPGSTLNWVRTLFYNPPTADEPDPALPFVRTPAGKALIESAGQTPSYQVFGTNNAEITQ